jgi:hypothetical protein
VTQLTHQIETTLDPADFKMISAMEYLAAPYAEIYAPNGRIGLANTWNNTFVLRTIRENLDLPVR